MQRRWVCVVAVAGAVIASAPSVRAQSTRAVPVQLDRSDRVARATVALLVGDVVRARGVVLADDGRIVTALAPLGGARTVTARYPNGRTGMATVVATDAAWGLALLQPRGGAWQDGLSLATNARGNAPVRWMAGPQPQSRAGLLRRRRTFVGPGAVLLRDAWELDPAPDGLSLGSGVANAAGELVAVVVAPDPSVESGGAPAPFGVPATVVSELVAGAGVTARPWLGFIARTLGPEERTQAPAGGIRVTEVTPLSPADRAGVRAGAAGDVIVAVDLRSIRTVEDLAAVLEPHHPGDTIVLTMLREGVAFDLSLRLGTPPPIGP
jgi:S1-C subfamily serine protease